MPDSQDEIPLRGPGIDDAIVSDTEPVKPGELAGQWLAGTAFGGESLLDLSQNTASYRMVEPIEISGD